MRFALIAGLIALVFATAACGGNGNGDEEPPTIVPPSPEPTSAEATPTSEPEPTPTSAPAATTAPAPTNTAVPQDPGSTDPFSFNSNPDPLIGIYTITDVRVGAHPESGSWDRIVFEFEDMDGFPGAHPGGMIEYVDEVFQCGSGDHVEVDAGAILHVRFDATQAHDDDGQLTIDAIEIEGPGNSILQARLVCDFEGIVEWVIAVPGEQNFRVVFLENPSRAVIDIKWP